MKKKTKKSEIKKKITNKATEIFSPKKPDYTSSVIAAGGIAVVVLVVAASAISFQFSPGRGFLLSPDSKTGKNLELVPGMHMGSEGMADADNMAENMMDHQGMVMQKAEAIADSNRIKFKVNQFKKLAAQPLEFEVFDENGTSLKPDDLQTVHEKKLHLIIVSADLRDYQHLHPYFEGGKWKVLAKLLAPGTYYAYAEITPVVKGGQVEAREVVLRSDLIVQNPTTGQINYIGPTPNLNSYNRGYTAQLQIEKPLVYQQTKLSYQLVNKNKIAINYLRQHLGEIGRAHV